MLTAIQLDNEVRVGAKEIDNKAIDWELSSKFPAAEPGITQTKPQHSFRIRLIAAQALRGFGACLHRPNPLTPTLSPPGRGSAPCAS
ncbi:MAG: hypothetical protein WB764_17275, partial [Xanthobacteraceae bacterium]